jgi:hypothetical protein
MPQAILVSDDTFTGFASKMKLQMVGEKVIAFAAHAMQCQAMTEPAK